MGILLDKFRETVAKNKDPRMREEGDMDVLYSTGFPCFDFINGCKIKVHDEKNNQKYSYYSLGVTDGAGCMLIGRSGCGKTTLAIQMAANITRNFENSEIFHDDIEGGVTENRRMILTRWSPEMMKAKYRYRNKGITAENFYETLSMIKDIKLENYENLIYNTGYVDMFGNPIYKLPPTVYILDSVAMLMPEKYSDEDELSGSMAATAAAKTNSALFKRIIPMLKAANIILITINHITDAISINPMQRKKAAVSYLKPDEAIGGGKAVTYLTNLMLRLDDVTKLKEGEGMDVAGSIVDLQIIKSRSGRAGSVCSLVFDQRYGFDSDLSLFLLLKNEKRINGAGAYLYIGDHNDMKFRQSELKTKLATDPAFAEIFMNEAIDCLKSKINDTPDFLDDINAPSNEKARPRSISDSINDIINKHKIIEEI